MKHVHEDHDEQHQDPIENVYKYFVALDIPAISVEIFDDSKNGTDENGDSRREQSEQQGSPTETTTFQALAGLCCRILCNSTVENDGGNHENAEEQELHE